MNKVENNDLGVAVPNGRQSLIPSRQTLLRFSTKTKKSAAAAFPVISFASENRTLDTNPDAPDLRDRYYEPVLKNLAPRKIADLSAIEVLDQKSEGACTGFALAGVVNLLNVDRRKRLQELGSSLTLPKLVSPRMLYEMARLHDEWTGVDYDGSSIRGALKGLYNNGVCSEQLAPYRPGDKNWSLTVPQAKDARNNNLGAYYRLRPDIVDYHAALGEVDALYVSARVHSGWSCVKDGRITYSRDNKGGHAFAIVGYDEDGFFVLNSWGPKWGGGKIGKANLPPGVAHWSYEDWGDNIMDAWVLQLAVPAPKAFDVARSRSAMSRQASSAVKTKESNVPRRAEIIGHVFNIDDGKLQEQGRYATPLASLKETGALIAQKAAEGKPGYQHVVIVIHGGLNSLDAGAIRAACLKEPLLRNGIYPVFALWGTGFFEEFGDVFKNAFSTAEGRVGGVSDFFDKAFESFARPIGRPVWNQMKADAEASFKAQGGGTQAIKALFEKLSAMTDKRPKIHIVAHSAGAILTAYLLEQWAKVFPNLPIDTLHFFAPACRLDLYEKRIAPVIGKQKVVHKAFVYNLTDDAEQDDTVGSGSFNPYHKSLLYLVSNSFEDTPGTKLLGMSKFADDWKPPAEMSVSLSPTADETKSTTHGGFDNDKKTMNTVLARIIGSEPSADKAFTDQEMIGY